MFLLLATSVVLSLDSFAVCLALGALRESTRRRRWLVLAFVLCDGLATWIGLAIGMGGLRSYAEWSEWLGPAAVSCYGLYVLYLAWRLRDLATRPSAGRWLVFGLPVCLSLDNLVVGAGAETSGVPSVVVALVFGLVSGAMALLGLWAGSVLTTRVQVRTGWLGGVLLIFVAGVLVLKEALS